jgi:threonine aldolase
MRYVAVQFGALLARDIWMTTARQANSMAALLEHGLRAIPGIEVSCPLQADAVFAVQPGRVAVRAFPSCSEIGEERGTDGHQFRHH